MADWRVPYLRALGARPTPAAMSFLAKWQPWEGGATNNAASYNYFNTTQNMPGSKAINSVGVQAYGSLAQGAQAFAKTLLAMPQYSSLVSFLRTGQGDPTPGLATWVSGQPDSQHGLAYAAKILGSHTSGIAPGGSVTPPNALGGLGATPLPPVQQSALSQAASIRKQAVSGLGQIATGQQTPMEAFTGLSGFIKTLQHTMPQIQQPSIDPATGQSDPLEQQAVQLAQKYLGVKYTWGGTNAKSGFDCSGLVQHVWGALGVKIPRTTYAQWDAGKPVAQNDLKPGDEVFFTGSDPMGGKPGHEGLYIGQGKFIEAPGRGMHVRISTLAGRSDYVGGRRFA